MSAKMSGKVTKIVHLADLHFSSNNIAEYPYVLEQVYSYAEELVRCGKKLLFVIAGDVVDNCTFVDSAVSNCVVRFFSNLMKFGKVVVVAGNHDFNYLSPVTMRLLADIVNTCKVQSDGIVYISQTGCYNIDGIYFAVCCLIDHERTFIGYDEAKTLAPPDVPIICIFHGMLREVGDRYAALKKAVSVKEGGGTSGDIRTRSLRDFGGYAAVMMGDIHMHHHYRTYAVYAGSLMQLNFGEDTNHGFVTWDYPSLTWKFVPVQQEIEKVRINYKNLTEDRVAQRIEEIKTDRIHLFVSYYDVAQYHRVRELLHSKNKEIVSEKTAKLKSSQDNNDDDEKEEIATDMFEDLTKIREKVKEAISSFLQDYGNEIVQIHKKYEYKAEAKVEKNCIYRIHSLAMTNFTTYHNRTEILFERLKDLVVVMGSNAVGKSSIVHAAQCMFSKECGGAANNSSALISCMRRSARRVRVDAKISAIGEKKVWSVKKKKSLDSNTVEDDEDDEDDEKDKNFTERYMVKPETFTELQTYQNKEMSKKAVTELITTILRLTYLDKAKKDMSARIKDEDKIFREWQQQTFSCENSIKFLKNELKRYNVNSQLLREVEGNIANVDRELKYQQSLHQPLDNFHYLELNDDEEDVAEVDDDAYKELAEYYKLNSSRMRSISQLPKKPKRIADYESFDIQLLQRRLEDFRSGVARPNTTFKDVIHPVEMSMDEIMTHVAQYQEKEEKLWKQHNECVEKMKKLEQDAVMVKQQYDDSKKKKRELVERRDICGRELGDLSTTLYPPPTHLPLLSSSIQQWKYTRKTNEFRAFVEAKILLEQENDDYEHDDAEDIDVFEEREVAEQCARDCEEYRALREAITRYESRPPVQEDVLTVAFLFEMTELPTIEHWHFLRSFFQDAESTAAYQQYLTTNTPVAIESDRARFQQLQRRLRCYARHCDRMNDVNVERATFERHLLHRSRVRRDHERYTQLLTHHTQLELSIREVSEIISNLCRNHNEMVVEYRGLSEEHHKLLQMIQTLPEEHNMDFYLELLQCADEHGYSEKRLKEQRLLNDIVRIREHCDAVFLEEFRTKVSRLYVLNKKLETTIASLHHERDALNKKLWELQHNEKMFNESAEKIAKQEVELQVFRVKVEESCKRLEALQKYHELLKNNKLLEIGANGLINQINTELNFLIQDLIADKLVAICEITTNDTVSLKLVLRNTETGRDLDVGRASGFERTICELALRCVLYRYYPDIKYDTIFIDDSVQKMDDINITRFAEMLHRIKKYYPRIVLITHNIHLQQLGGSFIHVIRHPEQGSQLDISE